MKNHKIIEHSAIFKHEVLPSEYLKKHTNQSISIYHLLYLYLRMVDV